MNLLSSNKDIDMQNLVTHYDRIRHSGEPYVLTLVNIKNFRYYNTRYGATQGDEILTLVYNRLSTFINEDEYLYHWYADNFIILFRIKDEYTFMHNRHFDLVYHLYRIEDERIFRNLNISCGAYHISKDDVSIYDAINLANLCRKECDTLLKRSGCIEMYSIDFYHKYMDRLELEERTANAYKNYEFVTFLQPKVDVLTHKIIGAEALIRWYDKDGNLIPVHRFLPILNLNGYIKLLDLDTFDIACKMLYDNIQTNKEVVPISFNISKATFYNPNFIDEYLAIYEKYKIPKHLIEFELMESISLDDTKRLKEVISIFKTNGFSCSLDDFGSGYSSFNVLLNAELKAVKLDRQFFLKNLYGDNRLIIKTVIDLIHSLHIEVIAEGVEEEEHVQYLKECGCDAIQGFYFYKPMPIDSFNELLQQDKQNNI